MNIVIVNAYDRHNAGDAALLSALIGQVRETFPQADLRFAGLEDPRRYPEFDGAHNVGSIRRWAGDESIARPRRVVRKGAAMILSLMPSAVLRWLSGPDGHGRPMEAVDELRALVHADLVIGLGGGYLNGSASLAGTLNVFFVLLPLWLARRLHRPIVLAPQSYGPFGRPLQTTLVRLCLNRVDHIVVREDVSLDHLRAAGIHEQLLVRGVDSAFTLGTDGLARPADDRAPGSPRVGITARAWLAGPGQESYERSLAAFMDWLSAERGASVTIIPQVTSDYREDDDRLVSRRVASYCHSSPTVIDSQLDHAALRTMYGDLDYLVGTRFHSVIFSLTMRTPALAIEYEHKTSGIMRDLGLGHWVIPMEQVSAARLCDRFVALEAARSDYLAQLHDRLPDYVDRAREFATVLRRSVP